MSDSIKYCITLLEDNEEYVRKNAQEVLLKVCENILSHPEKSKYKKIVLADELVTIKLLPCIGAIECLLAAGFIEDNDGFLLPMDASLTGVKELFYLLKDSSKTLKAQILSSQPLPCICIEKQEPNLCIQSPMYKHDFGKNNFFRQLMHHFQAVLRYEDKNLQNKVKLLLPLEKLQIAAVNKLREMQKEMKIKNIQNYVAYEDIFLNELLNWFKLKFFKWIDSPTCKICMGECTFYLEAASPNPQISRIEIHKCKICGSKNEFPRYTDPEPLLYTRQGRCGEWANCFTLICRTVGFDARLIYDQTDHVWTEIWSIAENRWIHADACENTMDRPLLYEKGWGKKLSYIFAFSKDEIQDVTWRYTNTFEEVMKRRSLCSEEMLILLINKLNFTRQTSNGYSNLRRKFVIKRSVVELASMINAPTGYKKVCEILDDSDYVGRISGSHSWRISRSELRNFNHQPMQWSIPQKVTSFELVYSIINDYYTTRDIVNNKILETKQKWQSGIELLSGGVFLKKEEDWKMIYLARSPGSINGKITWSFIVENDKNMFIHSIKLQATVMTFNKATVEWEVEGVCYRDSEMKEKYILTKIMTGNFETIDFHGAIKLRLSAILRGGNGDTAWQQAQLFRQSLSTNSAEPSMMIRIILHEKGL